MSQDSSAPRLGLRRWLTAHAVILFGVFLLGFAAFGWRHLQGVVSGRRAAPESAR